MKMNKKLLILGIAVLLLAVGLSGCTESPSEVFNPPQVEVTSRTTRTGYEGLDYVVYVDCTVKNYGGSGRATVYAEVTQGSSYWQKEQQIYINDGESRDLSFTFKEISFWTLESGSYRVWVE